MSVATQMHVATGIYVPVDNMRRADAVNRWLESYRTTVVTDPLVRGPEVDLQTLLTGTHADVFGEIPCAVLLDEEQRPLMLVLTTEGTVPRIECREPSPTDLAMHGVVL